MRIVYEGEVNGVSKIGYEDDGNTKFISHVEWKRSTYTSDSVSVPGKWELGAKVRVTVETLDHEGEVKNEEEETPLH